MLITIGMVLAISACANVKLIEPVNNSRIDRTLVPAVGETATRTIGETLITQGVLHFTPAIKLRQSYQTEWIRNSGSRAFPFKFDQGATLAQIGVFQGVPVYVGPSTGGMMGSGGVQLGIPYGIGVQDNGAVALVYANGGVINETPGRQVSFSPTQQVEVNDENLKQEFIYSGRSGDSLFFLYREFINDLARPAFSQNVTYSLKDGNMIGFKSLKMEVLSATNVQIQYRVLSGF